MGGRCWRTVRRVPIEGRRHRAEWMDGSQFAEVSGFLLEMWNRMLLPYQQWGGGWRRGPDADILMHCHERGRVSRTPKQDSGRRLCGNVKDFFVLDH